MPGHWTLISIPNVQYPDIGHSIQFQFPQFQSYDKAAVETARRELKQIGKVENFSHMEKTSTPSLLETSPDHLKDKDKAGPSENNFSIFETGFVIQSRASRWE